jgi:hypothetical protein
MCNQNAPSVTLQTAVLMMVKEFANQGKSFSVHDVTTAIRNKIRDGDLEVPECEVSGASFRSDIRHYKIKALFLEAWNNGVFDTDFRLDRNPSSDGTYFVYTATLNVSSTPAATFPTFLAPANIPAPPVTAASVTPPVKPNRQEVTNRVKLYLNHAYRPTLKQVQSAIKRGAISTGWSCAELQDIIKKDLDYDIEVNSDCVSKSEVVI